ncbi:MAG: dipeptidase [Chloroflexi bacterium HGW-Chloroflexi-4]|jgi:acetylornithine deacetylase/succinyl-diaminopimelate desuccinylase-like protein|nr:MAG: dipeptidase [Chloroflexi bacterium HGW-Chloroflexi-4]
MEYNQEKDYKETPLDTRNLAISYATSNYAKFLNDLKELIAIPSVSTEADRNEDVKQCAETIANRLTSLGIEHVQVLATPKHPIVYGDYMHAGKDQPVVLIYGHYDVQPVDPIELWNTPPFEGVKKDDFLFGRGASDMKGQFIACLAAVESIMKTGELPVNIKFILEGEEEIGSPSLHHFLVEHTELLKADVVLNPDTGMIAPDAPAIIYGLRGLAYFEIRTYGPDRDLHSGTFGGVIHNPAQVLCDLIAGMHDSDGRIMLPGFYDSVLPLSTQEREELNRLNMNDAYYASQAGVSNVMGEKGYTSIERIGARPTLEVNGFLSGFTGPGAKTIIPSKAMAKISTRLVPNQDPKKVHAQMIEYMEKNAPKTIRWEVELISTGNPSISDINLPETKALVKAFESIYGVKPVFKREGGSVPVTADMQELLGIDSVLTGFGLPDDNIHSPNERLHLPTWEKGILTLIHFFFNIQPKGSAVD